MNELVTVSDNRHNVMSPEQVELIRRTVADGATNDELALFLHVAQRSGLDPFARQVYCVKRWNKALNREVMSIQTGIDGYRLVADRSGKYAGNDDPEYGENQKEGDLTVPTFARVTVWKMVGGIRCSFTATARWSEYYPGEKQGYMWRKMPFLMLAKTAEALALRKAFPADLTGIYVDSEMDQAKDDELSGLNTNRETAATSRIVQPSAPKPALTSSRAPAVPAPANPRAVPVKTPAQKRSEYIARHADLMKQALALGLPEEDLMDYLVFDNDLLPDIEAKAVAIKRMIAEENTVDSSAHVVPVQAEAFPVDGFREEEPF